ncbi:uncharacterized protein LOC125681599 isoform X2 [Ostrea edulis]|uniref:uncharacterized protein LOC125681599 isoform X2 n=1 Tax=Ostrea edulis TaxID=37623 RepID=UPI0024AFE3B6|nr:uncharacterized protein LOC125681599 isoform X2 [Ostrea edulis]
MFENSRMPLTYGVKMELVMGLLLCITPFSQASSTPIGSSDTTLSTTTLNETTNTATTPELKTDTIEQTSKTGTSETDTTEAVTTTTMSVSNQSTFPYTLTMHIPTTQVPSNITSPTRPPSSSEETMTNAHSTSPNSSQGTSTAETLSSVMQNRTLESTTIAKVTTKDNTTDATTTDQSTNQSIIIDMHSSSEPTTVTGHLPQHSTSPHPSTSTNIHSNIELNPNSLSYPQEALDRSQGYFTFCLTLQENSNVTRNRTLTVSDEQKIVQTLFRCSEETSLAMNCDIKLVEVVKLFNQKGFNTTYRIRLDGLRDRNLSLKAFYETFTNGTDLSIPNLNLTISRESIVTSFEKYIRGRDECDAVGVRCPRGYQCHVLSSDHYNGTCVHLCDVRKPCGEHGVCFYDSFDVKNTSCRCRSTWLTLYYGDSCTEQTGKFEYVVGFSLGSAALVVVMVTVIAVLCRRRTPDGSRNFLYGEKSVAESEFPSRSGGVEVMDIKHRKSTKFTPNVSVYKENVRDIKKDDLQTPIESTLSDVIRTADLGGDSAVVTSDQSHVPSTLSMEFRPPHIGNPSIESEASNSGVYNSVSKPTERNPTPAAPNQPHKTSSKTHREKFESKEKIPLSSTKQGKENRSIEKHASFLYGAT